MVIHTEEELFSFLVLGNLIYLGEEQSCPPPDINQKLASAN